MLAALPLVAFLFLFILFYQTGPSGSDQAPDWRDAFAQATLAWGWIVVGLTLLLSLFHGLTQVWLSSGWLAVVVAAGVLASRGRPEGGRRSIWGAWRRERLSRPDLILLAAIGALAVLVGVVAFYAGPTDSDAISYHLPRAIHWAQNRSVAPFATPNSRQIYSPPWAEYVVLHFMVLLRSDRLSNFVEWFGMLGSVILVTRISSLIGLDRKGQLLAGLFAATLPPLVHQGSSSLNDGTAAYWAVCVTWGVVLARKRESSWRHWILMGGALGLAALTKATSLVYSLPPMLWFAWFEARRLRAPEFLRRAAAMTGVALAGALQVWLPSWLLLGSPFGSPEHIAQIANQAIGVRWMLSNAIRALGLLAATPFDRVNALLYPPILWAHRLLGLTVSEPAITYAEAEYSGLGWFWPGEDSAPIHLFLVVVAIVWAVGRMRRDRDPCRPALALSAAGGFLLFNLLFQLQWTPRFHLAMFLIAAPVVGEWLSRRPQRSIAPGIVLVLFLVALPVATMDRWRPVFRVRPLVWNQSVVLRPRDEMYFLLGPDNTAAHAAAEAIEAAGCRRVGLILDSDDWEYSWWMLFNPLRGAFRIEHFLVFPAFERFRDRSFEPCAVVCSICDETWEPIEGLVGREMGPGVWLYLPEGES